jgi:hypothetical protein
MDPPPFRSERDAVDAALGALLAHPLIASYPEAKAILDDYVAGLSGLLPALR